MKKRIHVNQHNIRKNLKDGGYLPVITCKTYKQNIYGHTVVIHGESKIIYPESPMSCGARVWVETKAKVTIINELTGEEITI